MSDFNINFGYKNNKSNKYESSKAYLQTDNLNPVNTISSEEDYGNVEDFDYEAYLEEMQDLYVTSGDDVDTKIYKDYSIDSVLNYWEKGGIKILNLQEHNESSFVYNDSDVEYSDLNLNHDRYLSLDGEDVYIGGWGVIPKSDIEEIKIEDDSIQIKFESDALENYLFDTFAILNSDIKSVTITSDNYCHITTKKGITYYYDNLNTFIKAESNLSSKRVGYLFDEINKYSNQYGGSQMVFFDNIEELLEDEFIHNFLQEKFPNATDLDYYLYLKKIESTGCSYVALANIIINHFSSNPPLFKKIFGYDMYTYDENGRIDYNYEYLVLEIYTYAWKNHDIHEIYDILTENYMLENDEELKDLIDSDPLLTERWKKMLFYRGSIDNECRQWLTTFLAEKDSNLVVSTDVISENRVNSTDIKGLEEYQYDQIRTALKEGKNVKIDAQNYDLYVVTESNKRGPIYTEKGGSHAMIITGITDNNELIVSSWGQKFILDITNSYVDVTAYDIDLSIYDVSLTNDYVII